MPRVTKTNQKLKWSQRIWHPIAAWKDKHPVGFWFMAVVIVGAFFGALDSFLEWLF